MGENRVSTLIDVKTQGTSDAVKSFTDVTAQAQRMAETITQADAASRGLNTSIAQMPDFSALAASASQKVRLLADDLGKKVKAAADELGQGTVFVADKLGQAGAATELLGNALDNALPGMSAVLDSFITMNPVAIASSLAMVGLNKVIGDMQAASEAAARAVEAQIDLENKRVQLTAEAIQRANFANSGAEGSVEARKSIIQDYAKELAEATVLTASKQSAEARLRQAEADKIFYEQATKDTRRGDFSKASSVDEADAKYNEAVAAIEKYKQDLTDVRFALRENGVELETMSKAAADVGITASEQAAAMIALSQGTQGATAALNELWPTANDGLKKLAETADNVFGKMKDFGKDVVKFANDEAKKSAEERAEAEKKLLEINAKLTDVAAERGRQLADRFIDDQRNAERTAMNDKLMAAVAYDQQVTKTQKLAELQQQANDADVAAQTKFFESSQKNLANYIKAEKEAQADYSRSRVRALEDMFSQLSSLASQRDVASFVNARAAGMTNLNRNDEDAGIASQKRKAQYEQQQADLQIAYNKENATRQQQLQQKLQQEQQAGQQQISAAERVRKQMADLEAGWATRDLQMRRQREDESYRQTTRILEQKAQAELKLTAGATAGVLSFFQKMQQEAVRLSNSVGQVAARGVPKFETGTPYVQKTGLAYLHKGEAVLTAAENAQRLSSGGNRGNTPIQLIIQNLNVGKVATQADIDTAVGAVVDAIASFGANSNN